MHVLAAALAGLFLSPLNWIIILVVIQFFVNPRAKKMCWLFVLFIFIVFGNQWLLNRYARMWNAKQRDITNDKPYNCAIVLGGFGSPDENGNGYFNSSADRFIQAVKLYKMGKVKHIIISGGNGKDSYHGFGEGKWAKEQMEIFGIPGDSVLYEDNSDNTVDNAANVKRILDSNSLQPPYLLITSAAHIHRAAQVFKNAGIPVTEYPCNYEEGMGNFVLPDIIPDSKTLVNWNEYLKETAGYYAYRVKGSKN